VAFLSSFRTLEMKPLPSKFQQEYTLFLVAFFTQEKSWVWDPNSEICTVLSLFQHRKLLSKMIHFWMYFWDANKHYVLGRIWCKK
jgi:hypothetical protein